MTRIDKVIVTNTDAMKAKYASHWPSIHTGIQELIEADQKKGIRTKLVSLSSKADMKKCKAKSVTKPGNCRQTKAAIDKIATSYRPHYILILGAGDIVPSQRLKNPLYGKRGDPDKLVASDLPYACEHPYSDTISDFVDISRVVGRLPDIHGVADPSYLAGILTQASNDKPRKRKKYKKYLSISAQAWSKSTKRSIREIFHNVQELRTSPKKGPEWREEALRARIHFINCHGVSGAANFFGQAGDDYPVALQSAYVQGKLRKGTVAISECCYGAQLFEPTIPSLLPMPNAYLSSGACGYFGSTTTAYGAAAGNENADLISKYFAEFVLQGCSLGRATLQARHKFLHTCDTLNPFDLKTLAQFVLLGDPAVHPVKSPEDKILAIQSKKQENKGQPIVADRRVATRHRRTKLRRTATTIAQAVAIAAKRSTTPANKDIRRTLESRLAQHTPDKVTHTSFVVTSGQHDDPGRLHVAMSRIPHKNAPGTRLAAVVAHEQSGVIESKTLLSR